MVAMGAVLRRLGFYPAPGCSGMHAKRCMVVNARIAQDNEAMVRLNICGGLLPFSAKV